LFILYLFLVDPAYPRMNQYLFQSIQASQPSARVFFE